MDPNDPQLDTLLKRHFAAKLDGQLGRAASSFQRFVQTQPALPPRRLLINRYMIGLAGAALAAGIAVVFLVSPMLRFSPTPGVARNTNGSVALVNEQDPTIPLEREVAWRTLDRGTVFIGDEEQPMRSIVRQRVDNYRWSDPNSNLRVEMSVPQDEVQLVAMKSY